MPQGETKSNFVIDVRTITSGHIEENRKFATKGLKGAFRVTVAPLDRGERSSRVLQVTGWLRAGGKLEIRVGQADLETGLEFGEQMVFETIQTVDLEAWAKLDYVNPRRPKATGKRYKTKAKRPKRKLPDSLEDSYNEPD